MTMGNDEEGGTFVKWGFPSEMIAYTFISKADLVLAYTFITFNIITYVLSTVVLCLPALRDDLPNRPK